MASRKEITINNLKGGFLISPKGTARYAYVGKPDDSTYGKGKFRITVVFDKADPEYVAFVQKLDALNRMHQAEHGGTMQPLPVKLVDEKMSKGKDGKSGTGDAVGTPYMVFESNGKDKDGTPKVIPIYNAANEEENLLVYGGDIVRVATGISGWRLKGDAGVKGYLNRVQVLQSNWQGGGSGFGVEEEYLKAPDADAQGEEGAGLEEEYLEEEASPFEADQGEQAAPADPPVEHTNQGQGEPSSNLDGLI